MRSRFVLLLSALLLAATACATDETTAPDQTPEQAPEQMGATLAVASSELGDIVADGEGMTLYAFQPDEQGDPTCVDACLQNWPLLEAPATAGTGIDESLIGTVQHPSGPTQVTYNDWPLYYFANDEQAGDTNGQGVGDNWYVVSSAGEPITS